MILMGMLLLPYMSSNEFMTCNDCGQRFATADALRKHTGLGKEEKEPGKKRLCKAIDWTSKARKTGKVQT
jgi:hypothetical protein